MRFVFETHYRDSLRLFREVRALYRELGWRGVEEAVRDRMRRIPYPESRQELDTCRVLLVRADRVAMESYRESKCAPLAAIARTALDMLADGCGEEEERLAEFCREPGHRPQAQEWYARWLGVALLSFGRTRTPGDDRAVRLGLRARGSAEMIDEFLASLADLVAQCGLERPNVEALGVEVEEAALSRLHAF